MMARRRNRRGGGRVTPKGTRPGDPRRPALTVRPVEDPHVEFQLEMLTRDAAYIAETCPDSADICEADEWASAIQSAVASARCPDGVEASLVIAHARCVGGAAGGILAAAMAAYGPSDQRGRARHVLSRLVTEGASVPGWAEALGEVSPLRAVKLSDLWDESQAVVIDYARRDGAAHRLYVAFHPFQGGIAHSPALIAHNDEIEPSDDSIFVVEEISLADARATVEAGLRVFDEVLAAQDPDDPDLDLDATFDLAALVDQRMGLLPAGGRAPGRQTPDPQAIAGLLQDFASRPMPLGERPQEFNDLLHTMIGFTVTSRDRDILKWTPPRVGAFLEEWIPEHGLYCDECRESHEHPPDEEWLTTVESAFPRWLRFAAERSGLADGILELNLAEARESLKQMRLHATGSPIRLG